MDETKVRGVNLGGWLVLEKWITPSLFQGTDAVDEYTFMLTEGADSRLREHRRTFITEADFRWIAKSGLNAVRIPVGYWVFDGDAPYVPAVTSLDWAIEMAQRYKLHVLIDLHAAMGSQNGKDHSGRKGKARWFGHKEYQRQTIATLRRIAERYKTSPALWGIELLNEPMLGPLKFFQLRRFYAEAYAQISGIVRPGTHIVFSDAFWPSLFSGAIRSREGAPVAMDIHWYQFGRVQPRRYFAALSQRKESIRRWSDRQPVIIGEWSGMLSGATLAGRTEQEKAALEQEHYRRQLDVYETAAVWFYWTYKTEEPTIWHFRHQVERKNFVLPA